MSETKKALCLLLAAMLVASLGITTFAFEKIGKIDIPEKIEKLPEPKERASLQSTASAQEDETWYFDLIINFNGEDKNYFTHDDCWQTGVGYDIALVFDEKVDYDDVWAYVDGDVVWGCDIMNLAKMSLGKRLKAQAFFVFPFILTQTELPNIKSAESVLCLGTKRVALFVLQTTFR